MVFDAVMDGAADDSMGLAERKSFLGKVVCHVGGIREVVFKGFACLVAIDGHGGNHRCRG